MPGVLEYESVAGNDAPLGLPIPWEELISAGSQPSSLVISYSGEIDRRIIYLARQAPQGTSHWVDTMSSLSQTEIEFHEQKEAFSNIPPIILAQFHNQFVVSHNGEILDHDSDLPTLTSRFFPQHEDLPVYVAKVGDTIRATIATPFFD